MSVFFFFLKGGSGGDFLFFSLAKSNRKSPFYPQVIHRTKKPVHIEKSDKKKRKEKKRKEN